MKKTFIASCVAMMGMMGAFTAYAGDFPEGGYIGVGVGRNYTDSRIVGTSTGASINGDIRVGYNILPNLAAELRYGAAGPDTIATGVSVKNSHTASALIRLNSNVFMDNYRAYGVMGIAQSEYKVNSGGVISKSSHADFAYGLGAEFLLNEDVSIGAEWYRPASNMKVGGTRFTTDQFSGVLTYRM